MRVLGCIVLFNWSLGNKMVWKNGFGMFYNFLFAVIIFDTISAIIPKEI